MLNIIVTIDYEIFGAGTGDVMQHMVVPTGQILDIFDRYNVPLTIMFEASEYLKFVEYDVQIKSDAGYSYKDVIRDQVMDAYGRGHDVQLHVHPQWLDAEYKNSRWIMDDSNLSVNRMSPEQIDRLITNGKHALEKLIREVDPEYSCKALRLTNLPWCEAPAVVFDAMKKNKLVAHSLAVANSPRNTDLGYWFIDEPKSLIEIPIHSISMPRYRSINFYRVATALYRKKYSSGATPMTADKSSKRRGLLAMLLETQAVKWDFCKQSAREMLHFLDVGYNRYAYESHEVPLVMIAHSKDFFNHRNLDKFLRLATSKRQNLKFVSLGDFVKDNLLQ